MAASLPEGRQTAFLERTMQNTKGTQSRDQPQQDNQSKVGQQSHDVSAQVVGKSLNVNENNVRDQNQPGTEAVKGGERFDADNKN